MNVVVCGGVCMYAPFLVVAAMGQSVWRGTEQPGCRSWPENHQQHDPQHH